jgi:hypothetical protein
MRLGTWSAGPESIEYCSTRGRLSGRKRQRRRTQPLPTDPGKAKKVLEADLSFAGMTGLIRVPVERASVYGIRVVRILARTAAGFMSIVVRDARSASEAQLHRDAALREPGPPGSRSRGIRSDAAYQVAGRPDGLNPTV